MTGGQVCVAHLVRRANGTEAFRAFIESYRRQPAGVPHDLLLIFKGFAVPKWLNPYKALLDGLPHKTVFVGDFGYDMRPYAKVARDHPYRYFIFMNSFSRILVPGWLETMYRHARRANVGIVGATASYQSFASDHHAFKSARRPDLSRYVQRLLPLYRGVRYALAIRRRFPDFPNRHVRTNAFMVPREVINALTIGPILRKWDGYRFESGSQGMTRQIIAGGRQALIAGADGEAYQPPDWPNARTFWISEQENLLISDNRTRAYQHGSPALREQLAFRAWRTYPDGKARDEAPPLV